MLLSFALLARPPPSNGNGRRLDCVVCKVWRCLSECLQLDFWKGCRSKKSICSINLGKSSFRQYCLRKTSFLFVCFFSLQRVLPFFQLQVFSLHLFWSFQSFHRKFISRWCYPCFTSKLSIVLMLFDDNWQIHLCTLAHGSCHEWIIWCC